MQIRQVLAPDPATEAGLCDLLIDAVDGGASVGFHAPLTQDRAANYWRDVFAMLATGPILWVAEADGKVAGTVQLDRCTKENGRHRAEVQKLLVLNRHRGKGLASALLAAVESYALADGRALLVLDTLAGSAAEAVYQHHGWTKSGEIPDFASDASGARFATAYYFKRL